MMNNSTHYQKSFLLNSLLISVFIFLPNALWGFDSENSLYFSPIFSKTSSTSCFESYQGYQHQISLADSVVDSFNEKDCSVEHFDYNGNSLSFSKEAIIRGSLSLPSLKKIQIWGNAYFGSGHITPNEAGRIKNKLSGAMVGLTLTCGSFGRISGYYNFNEGKLDFSNLKTKAETNLAGLSYSMEAGSAYLTVLGTYGNDSYILDSLQQNRSLDYEGYQATGYIESGLLMKTNGLFALNPFGSLQYSYLEHDSIDRSTFSILDGEQTNYNAFYSTMGSRITVNLAGMNAFTLQGRMAWIHQLRSQNESIQNISFGRIPGSILPTQVFYEGNAGRDYFWGSAGLRVGLWNFLALSLDYDLLINSYQTTHLGSAGLLISF